MPSVSIVIPTYNGSRYILQTIESVLQQTYRDYEIIVVDDGSNEDIKSLLKPFADKISYIRIENSGPAAARNKGIQVSKGEFLALLDHDDIWKPGNLQEKVDFLQRNPGSAMVYSYPELMDSEGNALHQEYPSVFPNGSVFEDLLLRNWITTFSCTLIRRSIFNRVGLLDERREIMSCDDYDMWLRIADVSSIVFSPDRQVRYRVHDTSLIKNYDISLKSTLAVFAKALNECNSASKLSDKKRASIIKQHLYNKYSGYATKFYYDRRDYTKARSLFRQCISLKPYILKNWKYFLICILPPSLIEKLRSLRNLFRLKRASLIRGDR